MPRPVFSITILGSGSSMPSAQRNLSGQFINVSERFFLIDCGEGTQFQLIRFHLKFQRINHIFISHLHGDHFFGLPGLLSTMQLLGRTKTLHIYGPPDLENMLKAQHIHAEKTFSYGVAFHALGFNGKDTIYEDKAVSIATINLKHRIPCNGFLIREKPKPRKLLKEAIDRYEIPIYERNNIKMGKDFKASTGEVIPNEQMTADPDPPRSYAYCSDTAYNEGMIDQIKGVDILYHEATFMDDKEERAAETFHSTATQAARMASLAGVKRLLLGHFSARYKDLTPLLDEARKVHSQSELAREGETYVI